MQLSNAWLGWPFVADLLYAATFTTVVTLSCNALVGQQKKNTEPTVRATTRRLTAQQEQAAGLLKAAQAGAADLSPDMRAFVLWQVAKGFEKFSPDRADTLLTNAFRISRSVENNTSDSDPCVPMTICDVKGHLQSGILGELTERSPERVERLLPRAEPEVRKQIMQQLIGYYTKRKDLERAKQGLDVFADEDDYPIACATELMKALPQDRAGDRLAIFIQALNNFQQHVSHVAPGPYDFAGMVVQFWQQLPPDIVLTAIDSVLKKAQDKGDPLFGMKIGISGTKGSANFSSTYEYRLFELLPVLQKLDEGKADILLQDNNNVRALHGQYPKGLQSGGIDTNNSLGEFRSAYFDADADPTQAASIQATLQMDTQIHRHLQQIESETHTNAKQALSDALSLPLQGAFGPESCPRLTGLQEIASGVAERDPTAARSALEEERKLWEVLPDAAAGDMLIDAADSYRKIGDQDNAEKTLRQAFKIAERFYAKDTNADDPNQAFKGEWPSTNLWRRIVVVSGPISDNLPTQILADIPDAEIATLAKAAYGASLLGVRFRHEVNEQHKAGSAPTRMSK